MTTYSHGAIVIVDFPFTSGGGSKRRPALVVLDSGDADVVVARLTTQAKQGPHDVEVVDWASAGLRAPTIARLHKLLTVENCDIRQ
jgi:mRNA interferase MazF